MKQSREYLKEKKGSTTEEELNETVPVFPVTLLTAMLFALQNTVHLTSTTFNHSQCLKVNSL